ncbi:unnamed protein product [Dicrocoelium dendriticum]|nr:unnamed protein product [Dicrocoelium dendriticum]
MQMQIILAWQYPNMLLMKEFPWYAKYSLITDYPISDPIMRVFNHTITPDAEFVVWNSSCQRINSQTAGGRLLINLKTTTPVFGKAAGKNARKLEKLLASFLKSLTKSVQMSIKVKRKSFKV